MNDKDHLVGQLTSQNSTRPCEKATYCLGFGMPHLLWTFQNILILFLSFKWNVFSFLSLCIANWGSFPMLIESVCASFLCNARGYLLTNVLASPNWYIYRKGQKTSNLGWDIKSSIKTKIDNKSCCCCKPYTDTHTGIQEPGNDFQVLYVRCSLPPPKQASSSKNLNCFGSCFWLWLLCT